MDLREALFEAGAEIEEILKRQIRMQSADNMKFSYGFAVTRRCGFEGLVERHGVCAGRIFFASEGAQPAGRHAYIGGIDVAIDVEICLVAMHAFANVVGHPAQGEHITAAVESNSVSEIKTMTRHHLGVDRLQVRIVSLK